MKHVLILFVTAIAAFGMASCADDSNLTTTVAELTEAERAAMEGCLSDIRECRQDSADAQDFAENCRELMSCLPDRDERRANAADWRAHCARVENRCDEGASDDATCADLRARCEAAKAGGGDRDTANSAMEACNTKCIEDGGDPVDCRAECSDAEEGAEEAAAPSDPVADACYEACIADGGNRLTCGPDCY